VSDIYQDTLDAFFAEHSEPQALDFPCARCGSQPQQECKKPSGATSEPHAPRLDRMFTARRKRHNAAHRAGYAAIDAED